MFIFWGNKNSVTIGVTGTFMMEKELKTIGLGFVKCQADGKSMAEQFIDIYERFNIEQDKLFITSDNFIYYNKL